MEPVKYPFESHYTKTNPSSRFEIVLPQRNHIRPGALLQDAKWRALFDNIELGHPQYLSVSMVVFNATGQLKCTHGPFGEQEGKNFSDSEEGLAKLANFMLHKEPRMPMIEIKIAGKEFLIQLLSVTEATDEQDGAPEASSVFAEWVDGDDIGGPVTFLYARTFVLAGTDEPQILLFTADVWEQKTERYQVIESASRCFASLPK